MYITRRVFSSMFSSNGKISSRIDCSLLSMLPLLSGRSPRFGAIASYSFLSLFRTAYSTRSRAAQRICSTSQSVALSSSSRSCARYSSRLISILLSLTSVIPRKGVLSYIIWGDPTPCCRQTLRCRVVAWGWFQPTTQTTKNQYGEVRNDLRKNKPFFMTSHNGGCNHEKTRFRRQ